MLRWISATATACLLAGLLAATPADARPGRGGADVSLDRPQTTERAATLSGRVRGPARVVLQQRRHGRWHDVRTVPVRHGRYRTTVARRAVVQVFRTRAGQVASRPRTVAARVPTDACGVRPRKADGTFWSCTFADDFDGTSLDRTRWTPQTVFASGDLLSGWACYDDDPSVVSVGGGTLDLTVRRAETAQPCANGALPTAYRAGMVTTWHRFSQRYGRFEARIRSTATTAPGLQEAWWLWPDDQDPLAQLPWPLNGEIDIAETYSAHPDLAVPFLHYTSTDNGGPVPGTNTAWDCRAERGEWNTYTLEWTASRLEVFVNGRSCLVNTSGDDAFRKRYVLNLTQALGTGANGLTAGTPLPATTSVDYVRVWS